MITRYQQTTMLLTEMKMTECQTCKSLIRDDSGAKMGHDEWHKRTETT